jgi:O-antigen ligase
VNTLSSQLAGFSSRRRRLGVASGADLLLVPFLGVTLFVRVLTDDLSAPDSRHSGSLNLSGVIAVLFILVAIGLLFRRRRGMLPAVLSVLWLCIWTGIAVGTRGTTTEALREGVREISVVALAVIAYNARGVVTIPLATRLVQLIGLAPALVALYQLATNTGADIAGELRSNGTFAHPDSAAMFFAIAATISLWRYLVRGRHRSDASLTALFAAALVSTLSIDGLLTLVAMLLVFGALLPGALRVKLVPCMIAVAVVLVFSAFGAQRLIGESSTSLASAERGEAGTSLDWRLHKWEVLLSEWDAAPAVGKGLGTTTTEEVIPGNQFAGKPPHNEYIRYLVETGVIGLSVLLGALAILIRTLVRRRRAVGDALEAPTLAIVILVGCLVNSLADNALLNSPTCYAAALIIAAVLALPGVTGQRVPTARAV